LGISGALLMYVSCALRHGKRRVVRGYHQRS
jgi:hypothetical protein